MNLKGALELMWLKILWIILIIYIFGLVTLPVIFLNTEGVVSLFFKDLHEHLYFYMYGTDVYSAYSKWLCGVSSNCIF